VTGDTVRGQFVGQTPLRQNVAGVTLATVVHTHGRELPAHVHADPYLSLLVSGRYQDSFGSERREFQPEDATYSPPGFEHRDRIGTGGATFFTVSFDPGAGPQYADRHELWDVPHRWNACGPAMCLTRLHVQFVSNGGRLDPLNVDDCLFTLWAGLARLRKQEHRTAAWLDRARARLHDQFSRPPRVTELAADAGVHPAYFTRAFRTRYGAGPAEYRNRLRVLAGCRALAGRESIQTIALTMGYADQPHFTRDFMRRIGTTPAVYRQMIK
jgi:AraC family transcriptional regulator